MRILSWEPDGTRRFIGTPQSVAGVTVSIDGLQYCDGTVERYIRIDEPLRYCEVTSHEALQLGRLLQALADEMNQHHRAESRAAK